VVVEKGMSRVKHSADKWLLLLGMFSMTQIRLIGSCGISEAVILFIAPYLFVNDYAELRRDGFLPVTWLSLLVVAGCCIASVYNDTPFACFIRGFAAPAVLFSTLVVGHHLLRRSLSGIKWFYLGLAISWTINIFVFQRSVEYDAWASGVTGLDAVEDVMSSPIFWTGRISHWLEIPLRGWFYMTPTWFAVLAPLGLFVFAVLTTESGRSTAVCAISAAALALSGGKKIKRLCRLQRQFVVLVVLAAVGAMGLSSLYKTAALNGWMGEKSYKKYVAQITGREKQGVLGVLMGGRVEFFAGLYATWLHPIVGYGPWPIDKEGVYDDFILKYGTNEDFEAREKNAIAMRAQGFNIVDFVPSHSHIIGYWTWYGISGFLFWLYVLCQIVRYFRKDLATVPQWFGLLGLATPGMLWSIFFSPVGDLIPETMFIVALMMTRAVRMGAVPLSPEMIEEIRKVERT